MISAQTTLPSVFDVQALGALKGGLRRDDPQALKATAREFEALLLQMMLKSMRATAPLTGPFESDQTRFYQELLDAQLARVVAAQGGLGLAAVLERQLAAGAAATALPAPEDAPRPLVPVPRAMPLRPTLEGKGVATIAGAESSAPAAADADRVAVSPAPTFVAQIWPHALAASRATGLPARFIVAHAALESGWGRAEPRHADGRPSHNLFGIKAGSGWTGAVVDAVTHEFVNGVAERRSERFRAYASYAEAFADYARLLTQRYAAALAARDGASFAEALQRGGYATDPAYAQKLSRLIAQLA